MLHLSRIATGRLARRNLLLARRTMSAAPPAQGPDQRPSVSQKLSRFPERVRLMLPSLLADPRGTRFGLHASKRAPLRESSVSLLLSVCGYSVRREAGLVLSGASGGHVPVP